VSDIKALRDGMQNKPVTFVGSSVFCIFNLTNPQNSLAKLIDPDHPIMLDDSMNATKPADVMSPSVMDAQNQQAYIFKRNWDEYQQKWTQSFNTGVASFITHFKTKKTELDAPIQYSPTLILAARYHR
jgi:L-rhamnose isomerase